MTRKIFWGLWMTVWPAVALIPPLLTAQGPARVMTAANDSVVTSAKRSTSPTEVTQPQADLTLETVFNIPQQDVPSPDPFEPLVSESTTTTHRISLPTTQPAEKSVNTEAFQKNEASPAVATEEPPEPPPRTTTRPNSVRRTGPELTAQEERAQKLIHQRAMIRAQQRQARMAAKQWMQTTPRQTRQTTNWQPQLTQPNVLAEMDRIENP